MYFGGIAFVQGDKRGEFSFTEYDYAYVTRTDNRSKNIAAWRRASWWWIMSSWTSHHCTYSINVQNIRSYVAVVVDRIEQQWSFQKKNQEYSWETNLQ